MVEKLKAAGFAQAQAEAVVWVIADAQDELVTKTHLDNALEKMLTPIRIDLVVLKWMIGVLLAEVVSLVIKTFF
jgi:hypothetical protein